MGVNDFLSHETVTSCYGLMTFESLRNACIPVDIDASEQPTLAGPEGLLAQRRVVRGGRLQQQHAARPAGRVGGAAVHQQVREHHDVTTARNHWSGLV